MSWLTQEELKVFKQVGNNVLISKDARIFSPENVSIGDNVRIDAFTTIHAGGGYLKIGSFVHISVHVTLLCHGGVEIGDFAQVAAKCTLLSASDCFGGDVLIGPTVPQKYRKVITGRIILDRLSVLGVGCTLSPGTHVGMGSALGSMSMTKKNQVLNPNTLYAGIPCKEIRERGIGAYKLADELIGEHWHVRGLPPQDLQT